MITCIISIFNGKLLTWKIIIANLHHHLTKLRKTVQLQMKKASMLKIRTKTQIRKFINTARITESIAVNLKESR